MNRNRFRNQALAATDKTYRREIYQEIMARGRQKGGNALGVFKKQGGISIDYYVNGHRKRGRMAADERLAEIVLRERAGR